MTREEEICKAAEEFAFSPKTETPNFQDAINDFYYGAKWADENQPGMSKMRKDYEFLFMLKKRELIEKACEWMKSQTYQEWSGAPYERLISDEMIENFEKMMEE